MARKKLTEGMRQKENGVWELQETINGKRRSFSSLNPVEVIRKRDMARAEGAAEKILGIQTDEKPKAPLFEEVAEIYDGQVCCCWTRKIKVLQLVTMLPKTLCKRAL